MDDDLILDIEDAPLVEETAEPLFAGSAGVGFVWGDALNPLDITAGQLAQQTAYVMETQAESYRILAVALALTIVLGMRYTANQHEGLKGLNRLDRWVIAPAAVFAWVAFALKRGQYDQSKVGLDQVQATLNLSLGL